MKNQNEIMDNFLREWKLLLNYKPDVIGCILIIYNSTRNQRLLIFIYKSLNYVNIYNCI